MSTNTWSNDDIPLDVPNAARIYDYLLGGYHNFEIDRMMTERMIEAFPELRLSALASRACLRRIMNFLVAQGVEQFLDIGAGLPTLGNTHEVVQAASPAARVVYVDIDPIAVAHSQAILKDNANAVAIRGDLCQPDQILNHEKVKDWLDLSQPVALILLAPLAYVPDDETAYGVIGTLRDALAPGSYVAITHATFDGAPPGVVQRLSALYASSTAETKARSIDDIRRFFEGFELVEPGLVHIPLWRPEEPDALLLDDPGRSLGVAGVGRLPGARGQPGG
jgi:hypothetical protein